MPRCWRGCIFTGWGPGFTRLTATWVGTNIRFDGNRCRAARFNRLSRSWRSLAGFTRTLTGSNKIGARRGCSLARSIRALTRDSRIRVRQYRPRIDISCLSWKLNRNGRVALKRLHSLARFTQTLTWSRRAGSIRLCHSLARLTLSLTWSNRSRSRRSKRRLA